MVGSWIISDSQIWILRVSLLLNVVMILRRFSKDDIDLHQLLTKLRHCLLLWLSLCAEPYYCDIVIWNVLVAMALLWSQDLHKLTLSWVLKFLKKRVQQGSPTNLKALDVMKFPWMHKLKWWRLLVHGCPRYQCLAGITACVDHLCYVRVDGCLHAWRALVPASTSPLHYLHHWWSSSPKALRSSLLHLRGVFLHSYMSHCGRALWYSQGVFGGHLPCTNQEWTSSSHHSSSLELSQEFCNVRPCSFQMKLVGGSILFLEDWYIGSVWKKVHWVAAQIFGVHWQYTCVFCMCLGIRYQELLPHQISLCELRHIREAYMIKYFSFRENAHNLCSNLFEISWF